MKTKLLAILTPVWLLAAAVVGTIYLAWGLYFFDIDWLRLLDFVIIGKSELWHNFNVLMQYLTLPWVTVLDMPDFPSSASGLKHFQDVKYLFHLAQAVFILAAYPALGFLWSNLKKGTLGLYRRTYTYLSALPLVIGLLGVFIGFDQFFTLFHELLFPGDSSWLFNPRLDPIINVLPERYFLQAFVIFFVIYEAMMLTLSFLAHRQFKQAMTQ